MPGDRNVYKTAWISVSCKNKRKYWIIHRKIIVCIELEMADIDELFGGFDEPVGFDEGEAANPVVVEDVQEQSE